MAKKIILQKKILIQGIMCHAGCGNTVHYILTDVFEDFKKQARLPKDAELHIYPQPDELGIHSLEIKIKGEEEFLLQENLETTFLDELDTRLKEAEGPQIITDLRESQSESSGKTNWINILVNFLSMGAIIALWLAFPPSLPLTIALTTLSFLTTAFTAREYLINFFRNLRNKNFANMTTTISFGWFLSLAHTLYHAIHMPLISSFPMAFMGLIMPIMLITIINGMDEIKRIVLNKSKKMRLKGMESLFPQMENEYDCYQLSASEQESLAKLMGSAHDPEQFLEATQGLFTSEKLAQENTDELKEGMCIVVKRGECFPVDCVLIRGDTIIDASILSGESQLDKTVLNSIPAGAINLGRTVTVYAKKDAYGSTINKILFRANRARENTPPETTSKFTYLYTGLIFAGIIASVAAPLALGILTVPLLLQNVMGILFAVCPCTIAIAHQLPNLLSIFHRGNKGIHLRDETVCGRTDGIHTLVFDKTGTLTTGNSTVAHFEGISEALWERIYLLEKKHGGGHPIAKAITHYWKNKPTSLFAEVKDEVLDAKNRGLSANVQGVKIHIGNADYFRQADIAIPKIEIPPGVTPIYIGENNVYQGVIFIRHEPRKGIEKILKRLKEQKVNLIMLTGDSESSARGFNHQIGSLFDEENIHAAQTPQDKENFLSQFMAKTDNPRGVWFVGDGLNDAPCARIVSDKGGVSCAITPNDKAAFFTDISLNGSLKYLFQHNKLNLFLKKNILQNQWLLAYSSVAFLAFIISFSIAGIAVTPLIPLTIMLSTTFLALFNSYRVRLSIDSALDKNTSWPKRLLASDLSIGLIVGATSLLIGAVLIATIATGGLALPVVFTAGAALAVSSTCVLAGATLFGLFSLLVASHLFVNNCMDNSADGEAVNPTVYSEKKGRLQSPVEHDSSFSFGLTQHLRNRSPELPNEHDTLLTSSTSQSLQW